MEPGLYPSITVIVEAMNTLIQEKHIYSDSCIIVKVSGRTQKKLIYLANEEFGLAFFITDLRQVFVSNVDSEFGAMLREKGPHKPEFGYNIVRIHSLIIYTDLIDYNIADDTKAPILRCSLFISKLKARDIITTGQYMNYQTFSNLQFGPLLKKLFHSLHIIFKDTSGEKITFVPLNNSLLVLVFRKASNIRF